ncbi:MAG: transketolase [Jatrophihabitans sp.]
MTATEVPTRRHYGYHELPRLLASMPGDEVTRPSTLDVLWVLYDRILTVDADRPDDPDRDRFVLSKGHAPSAFYAVLAAKGFLDPAVLPTLQQFDSPLGGHPDRVLVSGAEIGSGSLGHGLPLSVGMAHGLRATGRSARVFCLIGDGELDEGSNHEAIAYAGAVALAGLTVVAVDNASGRHGWRGGIAAWFGVAGWATHTVDGRDHDALAAAFEAPVGNRPKVVVAEVAA